MTNSTLVSSYLDTIGCVPATHEEMQELYSIFKSLQSEPKVKTEPYAEVIAIAIKNEDLVVAINFKFRIDNNGNIIHRNSFNSFMILTLEEVTNGVFIQNTDAGSFLPRKMTGSGDTPMDVMIAVEKLISGYRDLARVDELFLQFKNTNKQ